MLLQLAIFALLQAGPAPALQSDSTLVIAPGDTVRILSSFVHDKGPSGPRRLAVTYATRIPPTNLNARAEQADRAAQLFGPQAIEIGLRFISIGICDTAACARRVHPPALWFLYERSAQGWRRVR